MAELQKKSRDTKSFYQSIIETIILNREIVIIKNDERWFWNANERALNVYYFSEFF